MTTTPQRPPWRRYAVAVLATLGGIAARQILGPVIVPSAYLTFYAAVLVSALYGGLGPGLLTTALSAFAGWFLYLPPFVSGAGADQTTELRVTLFVLIASSIAWLADRSARVRARIVESEEQLRQSVEALRQAKEELEDRVADRTAALRAANLRLQAELAERETAQEQLRASEERYALAVAGSNDGVWDWDRVRNEVYLSPQGKAVLGYEDAEIGSDLQEWVERIHPDDLSRVATALQAHLDGTTPHFRCEYRMKHKDGGYRWVLSRGVAVRDADGGAPPRIAGSLTDMTMRRQAEEDARRRQAEVVHAQRLSTLGEMTAGLAHELNQPLAAIVSFARGCERRIRGGETLPSNLLHAIGQIAYQALRAGEILRRYRTFVRTETSRDWVEMNALILDVVQFVRPNADEARVAIRLDLQPDVPPVLLDRLQIEQVLLNLIRNGIEAMDGLNGGEVRIRTQVRDGEVEVAVCDVGRGIANDIRERIFDTFFTTKNQGLGMGLSISRSIIDAHGGRIWMDSERGPGTTFCFTVPLGAPDEAASQGAHE